MKKEICALFGVICALSSGCTRDNQNDDVLSQRYIHKYGYAVSQDEWESKNYPGQVITHLKNGVTVTATYENGMLHGPMTYTFPHSQTVETCYLYNWGNKAKEIQYDTLGMPLQEKIQLSPERHSLTLWYREGTPMLTEEYAGEELVEGQYFTATNELESRVEKGKGIRLQRAPEGTLQSREEIIDGFARRKETFYPCGTPESVAYYRLGKLHGEKSTFAMSGEPIAIEEWANGQLHGQSTYFKNGTKYLTISYLFGNKNGVERHFIDGDILSQEISWEDNRRHGASTIYVNGKAQEQQWFYAGESVSMRRYEELNRMDEVIGRAPTDTHDENK